MNNSPITNAVLEVRKQYLVLEYARQFEAHLRDYGLPDEFNPDDHKARTVATQNTIEVVSSVLEVLKSSI
ncbi:hypothetical protein UFOVP820_39 [uncultured Caudovirales phage]|uniref:Uncharacterized protein n=1 Tax=uncultured Caudovirales phage TaxID=2100421 RepID=A0A6J5P0P4_9CAUD|nr:hypothetical protein UFOVP820_39 [uncultured Caudovirales phage]